MLKYMLKVYDFKDINELIMQLTIPADDLFITLEKLKEEGIVKAYLLDENV